MASYRERVQIIADILSVAKQPARKTQIMFGANLSFSLLKKYLSEILDAALLSFDVETNRYLVTPKGEDFLDKYKIYSKTSRNAEKHLTLAASTRKILEGMCSPESQNDC